MTLKDIADMAGVSVATVSHVLNHKDNRVSPRVAERVRKIMEQVDYQPNTIAKNLRSGKSRILGILTEDLSVWQVSRIVQGITHYAQAQGYCLVLSDLGMKTKIQGSYDEIYRYREEINQAAGKLRGIPVGGMIFVGMHDRDVDGLNQTTVPLVYAYCSTKQRMDVQVRYDNQRISRQVMTQLLKRYGSQVGGIDGPMQSAPARQRMRGVEEAYASAGIPLNLKLWEAGDWEYESGRQACERLLDSGEPIRAIYAFNDMMALGALHTIQKRGFRVPEDIEVVGFDDAEVSQYVIPRLTTVHVPLDEIGYQAAATLIEMLEEGRLREPETHLASCEQTGGQICLDCRIISRESCLLESEAETFDCIHR